MLHREHFSASDENVREVGDHFEVDFCLFFIVSENLEDLFHELINPLRILS